MQKQPAEAAHENHLSQHQPGLEGPPALPHVLVLVIVLTGGLGAGLLAGLGFGLGRALMPYLRSRSEDPRQWDRAMLCRLSAMGRLCAIGFLLALGILMI